MSQVAIKKESISIKKESNGLYYVWVVISILLMFGFGRVIPPFAGINEIGVSILGIFAGVLLMTIATDQVFWPALMGMFAMIISGFTDATSLLSLWLGNPIIQQIIWVMALTGVVTESGAVNVLARKMLSIKAIKGRPMVFTVALFFTVMICTVLVSSPTAMILLWYPILDGICDSCGIKKDSNLKRELLLGVYIAAMGAFILPFKGVHLSAIAVAAGILEGYGLTFDSGAYFTVATLIVVLFVLVYCMFIKYVWKTDLTPLQCFDADKLGFTKEDLTMNTRQKILLGSLVFGIVFLMGSFILPADSAIFALYSKVGSTWIWIFIFAFLCIFKVGGKPFVDGVKILQTKTMWQIVALAGCFMILGSAIASDEYGIKDAISNVLTPLVGNSSWVFLVIMCVVIATVFTNFTNGMPVTFTLLSVCIPFAATLELAGKVNASVLSVAIIMSGMCAFMTYGSIVYASLLLGREEITTKFMWTKGVTTNFIYIVVACVSCILFGYIL
ncbi:hypothetical protein GC105_16410 [Alkalibaculum sp. M08DMB]|uniref:Uncharacterized protein n=1 Tax=Alkalibaculum sporogenes TaxID=2655001 RepID=A0A6A7KCV4_9FIRM|nr:SLC13 family permease [Alkalibaculum sporogenes]MPW27348.1 hypothetical protein [Alkalibaculum sporogenes]